MIWHFIDFLYHPISAYAAARDRNILDEVCSHMPKRKKS